MTGDLTLEDRQEIQDLLSRYCHAVDRRRWDDFRALFAADCRLDLSQVMGLYEGREGIEAFIAMIDGLPLVMRHLVTNVLARREGESARVECYVLAVTGTGPNAQRTTGFYDDVFVREAGRWRLQSRKLTLDLGEA